MNPEIKQRFYQIRSGKIPLGYKKTKIGIIPEEWEIKYIGDIGSIAKGKGISKSDLIEDGIGCITYGEIYTKHHFIIKEFYSYINRRTAENSFKIIKGDIIFVGSGETAEEIGKCVAYLYEDEAYAGGDTLIFRSNKTNSLFLSYTLNSEIGNSQTRKLGQGYSVVHIYSKFIKKIIIPFPPLPEQRRIAEILSTWDKAIGLKEKLLEQKKLQKKSLMQQLLTGKLRTINPDTEKRFEGEWQEVRIGDVIEFIKKDTVPDPQNYKLLTVKLHLKGIEFTDNKPKVTRNGRPYFFRNSGEILIGRQNLHNGGIGIVPKSEKQYIASNAISSLRAKNNENLFFLFYLSNPNFYRKIGHIIGGTGQKEVSVSKLNKYKITIPKDNKEQQTIASILTQADQEIELIEKEIEQLKKQKHGLMQLLLTGIVRV